MAAYTGTLAYRPKAVNTENLVITEHELAQALVNLDTLTLTVPAGTDKDMVPLAIVCWSAAAPRVPQTNWAMTSYNKTTGELLITASGAVADNSTFVILWAPATTGS